MAIIASDAESHTREDGIIYAVRARSSTDRTAVFGTVNKGAIPFERTKKFSS